MKIKNNKAPRKQSNQNNNSSVVSPSGSLSFSMDDSIYLQTTPIINQISNLNQQQIQVRRPSELSICQRNSDLPSSQSPHVQIKSGYSSSHTVALDQQPTNNNQKQLNQIQEESSNIEQSMKAEDDHIILKNRLSLESKNQNAQQIISIGDINQNYFNMPLSNIKNSIKSTPLINADVSKIIIQEKMNSELVEKRIQKQDNSQSEIRWNRLNSICSKKESLSFDFQKVQLINDPAGIRDKKFDDNLQLPSNKILQLLKPLDPFNPFLILFEVLMSILIIILLGAIFISYGLQQDEYLNGYIIGIFSLFYLLDTLFKLRTEKDSDGKNINNEKEIVKYYFKYEFVIDLISFLPSIIFLLKPNKLIQANFILLYFIRITKIRSVYLKLITFLNNGDIVLHIIYQAIQIYFFQIFSVVFYLLTQDYSQEQSIIGNLYFYSFSGLMNNHQNQNQFQLFSLYCLQFLTLIFYIIKIGEIISILEFHNKPQFKKILKWRELSLEAKSLLRFHEIWLYFSDQFVKNQNYKKDSDLLLNPKHKDKLKIFRYFDVYREIPFLKELLSIRSLVKICKATEELSFRPNEQIFTQSDMNNSLFYIIEGNVQLIQLNKQKTFKIATLRKGDFFNKEAFFKNILSPYGAFSLGYSKIAALSLARFKNIVQKNARENVQLYKNLKYLQQKLKMLDDQIMLYNKIELLDLKCFGCSEKSHTIDDCNAIHFIVDKCKIINQMRISNPNQRQDFKRGRRHKHCSKKSHYIVEQAAFYLRQIHQNFISDSNQDQDRLNQQQDSIGPGIDELNDQLPSNNSNRSLEFLNKQKKEFGSDQELKNSNNSNQNYPLPSNFEQFQERVNSISPVPQIQQPNSQFSQSSYYLFPKDKDSSGNNQIPVKPSTKILADLSEKDKNSSNNMNAQSSSHNTNSAQYHFPPQQSAQTYNLDSQILIQQAQKNNSMSKIADSSFVISAKPIFKDSFYINQKRIQNSTKQIERDRERDSESPENKIFKQKTAVTPKQPQLQRNQRKSISLINDISPEIQQQTQVQQIQQMSTQQNQQVQIAQVPAPSPSNYRQPSIDEQRQFSKYGRASSKFTSKFTGETAKQFMKNPLEIPNFDFNFENNFQFSDYFPQNNMDKALDSYKQFQNSIKSGNSSYVAPSINHSNQIL